MELGERVPIPIESELQGRVEWFTRLRWIAGICTLAGTWAVTTLVETGIRPAPLYLFGSAILLYNALLIWAHRRRAEPRTYEARDIFLQIVLDWTALIFIVHFTGGLLSPVALAFTFHLIIGAILLSRRSCFFLAGLAGVLLGGLGILEEVFSFRPPGILSVSQESTAHLLGPLSVWLILVAFFMIVTYLATSITARLRERELALYESERDLGKAYAEMEALYYLGQIVNSTLDLNEVLSLIAEHAVKLLRTKACFIRLFDKSGERLYIGGAYGFSQAYVNKGPVEVSKSLIDSETLSGGVVQVYEVSEDTRFQYPEEARKEGLRSVLCVPVSAKSRVLGVLRTYTAEPHHFSEGEQDLLKNLANLGAVAIENARAYADLKAAHEERLWLARTTHHQLRSPLAAVRSTLGALPFAGDLSEKQVELVSRAERRVDDAFELIRDLLELASAQRPVEDDQDVNADLGSALESTLDGIRQVAEAKGLEFLVECQAEPIWVRAEAKDLERIFANLLDNAVKYTQTGGSVRFTVRLRGDTVVAEIKDTGIGIAKTEQQRVFDGFYRGRAAKQSGELGTGLGLSIVKSLVGRWGGAIDLVSREGEGTTVKVTLPAGEDDSPRSAPS